jgi:hypothetical protein
MPGGFYRVYAASHSFRVRKLHSNIAENSLKNDNGITKKLSLKELIMDKTTRKHKSVSKKAKIYQKPPADYIDEDEKGLKDDIGFDASQTRREVDKRQDSGAV